MAGAGTAAHHNVVVIDDDELVAETVVSILRSAGHDAVAAPDGVEGLELIRDGEYDAVVTDIMMPRKEGIETIMEIRRDRPALKIMAISGGSTGSTDFLQWAEKLGADAVLAKPFSAQEFLDALGSLWMTKP
ncbi:MAG: response regulator [Alphaproteobacteria bacterium]